LAEFSAKRMFVVFCHKIGTSGFCES